MDLPPMSPGAPAELRYFMQLNLQLFCSFTVCNLTIQRQSRFLKPGNSAPPLPFSGGMLQNRMLILEPIQRTFIQSPEVLKGSDRNEYYKIKPFLLLFFWLFPLYSDSDPKIKIIDNIRACLGYRQMSNLMLQLALSDT